MRVLIVSQYYPPETAVIPATIAQELASLGHQVRVLTGHPNYPEGRLYPGYRQRWRTRELDGPVELLRVPLWIDHSQRASRRALNYVSFGLSASSAFDFARGADVVYVYATQMTPALAPWMWRAIGGAPYVLHVQDLWPDSILGSSLVEGRRAGRIVDSVLTPWLSSVYRHAAAVIGIAPTMVKTLVERGVNPARAHLVYNWGDDLPLPPSASDELPAKPSETRILYGGNVGDMQDLETVVHAAHRSYDAGVQLTIVGDGVALPRVQALAKQLGAKNVTFRGRVSRAEFGSYYREADYALVSLKDLPVFRGTIPSKFPAALSNGKPVISNVQGDVRAFIDEFSIGFTADAGIAGSLESAFRRAAALGCEARKDMAERARSVYTSQFSLDLGIAAIENILLVASQVPAREHTKANGEVHAVR